MTLQEYLDSRQISKYHLSQLSGVPKTTIMDICSGKSAIGNCSAKTIQKIARALQCTMEEILEMDPMLYYDEDSGLPNNKKYFERGLPEYLQISLDNMKKSWKIEDSGEKDYHWDIYWCELNADINSAEVDGLISADQAWYLREKYLRMKKED